MKKFFKHILLIVSLFALIGGCVWPTHVKPGNDPNIVLGGPQMMNSYVMTASDFQVDSICVADTLPTLDTWMLSTFKDYETGETIVKRVYIKQQGETEVMYIITGRREPYSVTRRITK